MKNTKNNSIYINTDYENISDNWYKLKIKKVIINIIFKIAQTLSVSRVTVTWIENIPKISNFLLVSNHPSYIDWKILNDIFESVWINLPFICHGNLLKLPFIWDFFKDKWYLWVYNYRNKKYYTDKWYSNELASIKKNNRQKEALESNIASIKNSILSLIEWNNLGIFVTWWWYKDHSSKISEWYKLISTKTIQKKWDINLLPVKINFTWWYKNKAFPIFWKVEVEILKPLKIDSRNKEQSFNEIRDIYIK